jgi:predicted DNA-binding transcriptional regulator AlpA
METIIRLRTVSLIGKLLRPLADAGLIMIPELREILANLKHLAEKGTLMPLVAPRLINQQEAADMLGVSLSNFKKLEREGAFSFKRRMVGSSVRYRNLDVLKFIMAGDED